MSKSARNKPRNAKQKSSFVDVQSTKLHALCRNLVHEPDSPHVPTWNVQSIQIVEKYLGAGKDVVFHKALQRAGSDSDVFEEILDLVEDSAQSKMVMLTSGEPGIATMFCVPVLVGIMGGVQTPHLHLKGAAFDALTRTFKQHGVIHPDASVVLAAYLYHQSELDLPFSTVSRLPGHFLSIVSKGITDPSQLAQTGKESQDFSPEDAALQLYYLVGLFVDDLDSTSLGLGADSQEDFDAYLALEEKWRTQATELLHKALPKNINPEILLLGQPETYFYGYKGGHSFYADFLFQIGVRVVLETKNIHPHGIKAFVAHYYDEKDDIVDTTVSLYSRMDGDFIDAVSRADLIHENFDEAEESVMAALGAIDIQDIVFAETPVPLEICDCCGERRYIGPNDAGSIHHPYQKTTTNDQRLH